MNYLQTLYKASRPLVHTNSMGTLVSPLQLTITFDERLKTLLIPSFIFYFYLLSSELDNLTKVKKVLY